MFASVRSRFLRTKEGVVKFVMRFFILILTTMLLLTLSSLLYIFFYNLVIPPISIFVPLNFIFKDCGLKRCDYPTASVDFNTPPFQFQFQRGEHYKFILDLLVPDTPTNHNVGMFILSIEFIGEQWLNGPSGKQKKFKTEKKAAMLRYKSPLIQILSSILYSPLLVYGITEESQKITLEVVSLYEEKPEYSLSGINVIIESKQLNIYEGHLTIQTKLEGFRSVMYHHPVFSFLAGALIFLLPVIAAFLSVSSNSFEKKRKRFTAMISHSLEIKSPCETLVGDQQLISLHQEKQDVAKDTGIGEEKNNTVEKENGTWEKDVLKKSERQIETLTKHRILSTLTKLPEEDEEKILLKSAFFKEILPKEVSKTLEKAKKVP